jgi:hypothetical protein
LDRSTPESFRAFELAIRKLRFVMKEVVDNAPLDF